jgi:protein-tyrosine phosphatase
VIDLHCHILPGLDDGSRDLPMSLAMARQASADGVREIVCTPHVFDGKFEVPRARAEAALVELQRALDAEAIPLRLHLGSDCHLDPRIFDPPAEQQAITVAGTKYLLIEMPHELVPPQFEETVFKLRTRGIVPILTHPERNGEVQQKGGLERLTVWVEQGMLVQITGESLTGGFGKQAHTLGWELVRRGLCHFVASDAHSDTWRHPMQAAARDEVMRAVGAELASILFTENPERIVRNESVDVELPRRLVSTQAPRRGGLFGFLRRS